jgi:hypothetical protein
LQGNSLVKCIPPFSPRQRLGEHVPVATNTWDNIRIVGCVIFYAAHVLSKKSLWICLCSPLSLLGNSWVKTFPQQWGIVWGIVFYAIHVVSKASRRLVLPRNFCN